MKSFSSSSFASDHAEALDLALAAVKDNPQALFTAFQWFLYEGRDTVFYTAFSKDSFDKEAMGNIVAEMVALAPQLTHGFFGALPGDLMESARIDGASHLRIFFRILLPLAVPSLASLVIFQFMWVWNDLLVALVLLGGAPDHAPMTVAIANLVNSFGTNYEVLTAAAFISMALPLVIFFSLQRYFVRGILAGSVKG